MRGLLGEYGKITWTFGSGVAENGNRQHGWISSKVTAHSTCLLCPRRLAAAGAGAGPFRLAGIMGGKALLVDQRRRSAKGRAYRRSTASRCCIQGARLGSDRWQEAAACASASMRFGAPAADGSGKIGS